MWYFFHLFGCAEFVLSVVRRGVLFFFFSFLLLRFIVVGFCGTLLVCCEGERRVRVLSKRWVVARGKKSEGFE